MCIKVGFSDDSKGTFVCFFFAVMFHEFWERHLVFISFFPRYFAFVILVVVVFFSFAFFIFSFGRPELRIIDYICSNDVISIQNVDSYQTT